MKKKKKKVNCTKIFTHLSSKELEKPQSWEHSSDSSTESGSLF